MIKALIKNSYFITIIFTIFLAFNTGGVVKQGLFMGAMTAISTWILVKNFPEWLKRFIGKHVLFCDLISSIGVMGTISLIGNGPTIFMATITHSVLTSLYMIALGYNYDRE
jgi:hypothetical protein